MRIENVTAYPISVRIPPEHQNTIGIGRMYKRDAVIIKVETKGGLVGFGESHHARNPGAIAHLVNTTMRNLVVGMDAAGVTEIWSKIYKAQFASHGMGAGSVIAMSGIDMALWDIRGKAVGWPLYKLLGGSSRKIPAYAGGGGSLGFSEPGKTVEEIGPLVEMGFKAVKVRIGQTAARDLARISAVRKAYGDDLVILTDANAAYTVDDARKVMPVMESLNVGWLEEPFPAHDYRSYALAASFSSTPLSSGRERVHPFRIYPYHRRRCDQHPSAGCGESRRRDRSAPHRRPGLGMETARSPPRRRDGARSGSGNPPAGID